LTKDIFEILWHWPLCGRWNTRQPSYQCICWESGNYKIIEHPRNKFEQENTIFAANDRTPTEQIRTRKHDLCCKCTSKVNNIPSKDGGQCSNDEGSCCVEAWKEFTTGQKPTILGEINSLAALTLTNIEVPSTCASDIRGMRNHNAGDSSEGDDEDDADLRKMN
jgi:hypothetical protein